MAINPNAIANSLPALRTAEQELSRMAAERGILYRIADYGGLRTQADTTKILDFRATDYAVYVAAEKKAGRTPVSIDVFRPIAAFGSSYHNWGAAFDVKLTKWEPGKTEAQSLATLGTLAPFAGLRWGGTFSRPDTPHFELQIPLAQVQSMWKQYTKNGFTPVAVVGSIAIIGLLLIGLRQWFR